MGFVEWLLLSSLAANLVLCFLLLTAERRAARRADYRWYRLNEELETVWDRLHAFVDPRTLEHFRFWQSYPLRVQLSAEVKKAQAKRPSQPPKEPQEDPEKQGRPAPPPAAIGQGPSLLGGTYVP